MNKTIKPSGLQPSRKKIGDKAAASDTADFDPKMLQLLVCPLTKHGLELDAKKCELKSKAARLAYPIRGGVPILLPSEARALKDEEL